MRKSIRLILNSIAIIFIVSTNHLDAKSSATMVTLASWGAAPTADHKSINVWWTTSLEDGMTWFSVWRSSSSDGIPSKIKPYFLNGCGGCSGAAYSIYDSTAYPGVTYYYRISYDSDHGGDFFPQVLSATIPLSPKTIISSSNASLQLGMVLITWETSSEISDDGFDLFRCKGACNPSTQQKLNSIPIPLHGDGIPYLFEDRTILAGTTYNYIMRAVLAPADIYNLVGWVVVPPNTHLPVIAR